MFYTNESKYFLTSSVHFFLTIFRVHKYVSLSSINFLIFLHSLK